jgi:hypothetical protein
MADIVIRDCIQMHHLRLRPNALVVLTYVGAMGGETMVNSGLLGMTRQSFRSAVDFLEAQGLCNQTTTKLGPNGGTGLKLVDKRVVEPLADGEKPISNQIATALQPNPSPSDSPLKPSSKEKPPKGVKKKASFQKPTKEECADYAEKLGIPRDEGPAFWDHHESRNWTMNNKLKMSNWHSAMSTWKRNWKKFNPQAQVQTPKSPRREQMSDPQFMDWLKQQHPKIYIKHENGEKINGFYYDTFKEHDARAV